MACGRALLNHQDGHSIGKALLILSENVRKFKPDYDINTAHKEILLDFDDAEANAVQDSFGKAVLNIICGYSVHFTRSAMHVTRFVNSSTASVGYQVFMAIAKWIPDKPSMGIVQYAFDVLSGVRSFELFPENLLPNLSSLTSSEVRRYTQSEECSELGGLVEASTSLEEAYSSLTPDEWDDLVQQMQLNQLTDKAYQ